MKTTKTNLREAFVSILSQYKKESKEDIRNSLGKDEFFWENAYKNLHKKEIMKYSFR